MKTQVSGYKMGGVIMVREEKMETVGKGDSKRFSLRPPGRGGGQLAC